MEENVVEEVLSQTTLVPLNVPAFGGAVTVTELLLTSVPAEVVTLTVPEVEPTVTLIEVLELAVIVADAPPIVTDVAPEKFEPEIVNVEPEHTAVDEREEITGG